MQFAFGFGKGSKQFVINDRNVMAVLERNSVQIALSGVDEVRCALLHPIGTKRLCEIVKPGERTVIITSDITRPMPSSVVLPELMRELAGAGVSCADIKIIFAIGSHRKHTEEEKRSLVGEEIYGKVECLDSDPDACVHLGKTSYGTPIDIFRPVSEAVRRICLGNIEYHYFAGYSGGAKAIMPGVSTRHAIQYNHSFMVNPLARAGSMDDNPVRIDIEEAVRCLSIDFILNVVLDEKKNIIKAVSGHHVLAHREGCAFLDQLYQAEIPEKADIVVATPGGYPKDINLYQAQKALDNAQHAVRNGGIIILVASCVEGLGEEVFERWMLHATSPDSMIRDIKINFELGGHKAAAIGLALKKASIYLVSDMDEAFVRKLFFQPFRDVDEALEKAFAEQGGHAKVIVMPYAGSTLPAMRPNQ